jgi:hypothetical protein
MKATHLAVAALVALAATAVHAQEDCLSFPSSSDYHDESWFKAEKTLRQVMGGGTASRPDIDAAIANLRKAVGRNSTSSSRSRESTTGREFAYYPYVALAILEAARGRAECIEPLLARESRSLPADFQQQYDRLNDYAVAIASAKSYVDLTAQVGTLASAGQLSAAGATKSQEVVALGAQLSAPSPDELTRLIAGISKGVTDLAKIEAGRVRNAIDTVRAAVPSALDGVATSACDDPADTTDPGQLQQVVTRIDRCFAAGVQALGAGGREACSTLGTERDRVRDQLARLQKLGGSDDKPADLPAACAQGAAAWAGNDLDGLSNKFAALKFDATKTAYASQLGSIRGQINQSMGSFLAGLQAQSKRIFTVPNNCEQTLSLGSANASLRQLKQTLDQALGNPDLEPTPALTSIGDEIDKATKRLETRVATAVDELLNQKQEMANEGEDITPFEALSSARSGIGSSELTPQTLSTVCNAAAGAQNVVNEWGRKNLPKLWATAQAYRWFLDNATQTREAAGVDCIAASLSGLPQREPRAGDVAWANRTQEENAKAKECLRDFRDSRATLIASVESDLSGSVAALSRLNGMSGLPQNRLAQMKADLEASLKAIKAARAVLELPESADEAALRAGLQQAGVDATRGDWNQLGELRESDKAAGLRSIGERATAPLVGQAADTAARWSTKIGKLGAFAVLDGALTRFSGGDLDRAIRDLRGWSEETVTDPEAAALRHATLAYFLHTKWTLLPENKREQAVGALLYADASQEAQAAFRNDPDLRLPRALNDESFQQFVANCCM